MDLCQPWCDLQHHQRDVPMGKCLCQLLQDSGFSERLRAESHLEATPQAKLSEMPAMSVKTVSNFILIRSIRNRFLTVSPASREPPWPRQSLWRHWTGGQAPATLR